MNWLDRKIDNFIRYVRDNKRSVPVGADDDPKFIRWFVIPRNNWFNIYLHNFLQSDDEEMHDHRMANLSIVLQGSYLDERFMWSPRAGDPLPLTRFILVRRLRPLFRLPSTPHRVALTWDMEMEKPHKVWSLFIGGPAVREWGVWATDGEVAAWIHFRDWYKRRAALDAAYLKTVA